MNTNSTINLVALKVFEIDSSIMTKNTSGFQWTIVLAGNSSPQCGLNNGAVHVHGCRSKCTHVSFQMPEMVLPARGRMRQLTEAPYALLGGRFCATATAAFVAPT